MTPSAKRSFVVAAIAAIALGASSQSRELTRDEQVVHALNRLAFGPRPGDVERVKAVGIDRWIAQQLEPNRIDDRAMDGFIAQSYARINGDQVALLREYNEAQRARQMARRDAADSMRPNDRAAQQEFRRLREVATELMSSRVARAVASERQLLEVTTDFWMNHFNVFIRKNGQMPFMLAEYERGIRERAFGSFRDLLDFVAKSPAMLVYLDNAQSVADSGRPTLSRGGIAGGVGRGRRMRRPPQDPRTMSDAEIAEQLRRRFPGAQIDSARVAQARQQFGGRRRGLNENYARELLELHTLGVDGGYTQQDVIEVARALTGWAIRPAQLGGGFVFRPDVHDAGEKVVLGHRLAAGRGIEDGEQVLDIVASHPSTARYIATKLARRFVSDSPSTALIEYAAAVFTRTRGDIRETLRAIVTSPEFFSRRAYRSKLKSPFEVVVSAARALGATPDPTPRTAMVVGFLGQPIYGHQAPDGYPERGEAWMNTGAILNRINFGLAVGAGRLPGATLQNWPEGARLLNAPREEQVRGVVASLVGAPVSPQTERILITGEHPMVADGSVARAAEAAQQQQSMNDDDGETDPQMRRPRQGLNARRNAPGAGLAQMRIPDLSGLAEVVGLAIGSPEFQRR